MKETDLHKWLVTILLDEFGDLIMQWSYHEHWNTHDIFMEVDIMIFGNIEECQETGEETNKMINYWEITPVTWKPNGDTFDTCNH